MLVVVTPPLKNGVRVDGRTNLPDGTELMLAAKRGPTWADAKVAVQSGRFSAELYPRQGQPIPSGDYEVEVSSPFADLQPEHVKAVLGPQYTAVTGPLINKNEFGSRTIEYATKVNIGGPPSPAADRAARKHAYKEFEASFRRNCEEIPTDVEQLTGVPYTRAQRERSLQNCLRLAEQSRREATADGLIEP